MQRLHRSAFAAMLLAALVAAPRARPADSISTQRRAPAAPHTATRTPFPQGHTLLAPSFQFDGAWVFDAVHSDDPMKRVQSMRPPGGPGGEGGPRMAGGAGAGRGQMPMARVIQPAKKLVIRMQADQVSVSEDGHAPRAYVMKDSLQAHPHGRLAENPSARWSNGGLELTQAMGPRGKWVETYTLSHDGETLTIRARREGGPGGMPNPVLTRVYTR